MMINKCKVYNNVLDPVLCQNAIQLYEMRADLHDRRGDEKNVSFTTLNLDTHKNVPEILDLRQKVMDIAKIQVDRYISEVPEATIGFPRSFSYEEFRMKRYTKGKDKFMLHVDAGNLNSCRRFLMLLFYLNDVESGGETEFPLLDFKVSPKRGNLLMFPPLWTYPHKANVAYSGPKYTFEIYLHYTR